MKKLSILLLILITGLQSCKKDDKNTCIDPDLISPDIPCTAEYDPVCGCDGKTYGNACEAKFHGGVKYYTKGACGCEYPYTGTVVDMTGLDGCSKMIQLPNGSKLEVASLPAGFTLRTGMTVEFNYTEVSQASICMAGTVVEVTCIRETGCIPICSDNQSVLQTTYEDPIHIQNAVISGDCLKIVLSYGGGCHDNHDIRLTRLHPWCGTPPLPPVQLVLEHDGNGDLCQALITQTLSFDLTSLQEPGKSSVEFYLNNREMTYSQKFIYNY